MDISGLSGYYSDIYASAASNQAVESVKNNLSSVNSSTSDEELMDACKQFESYFVEQMFKEMWKTVPETEYSSGSTNSMVSFYKDEMIKTIAEDSTEQNGLGLAQMLYEQMKRNYGL